MTDLKKAEEELKSAEKNADKGDLNKTFAQAQVQQIKARLKQVSDHLSQEQSQNENEKDSIYYKGPNNLAQDETDKKKINERIQAVNKMIPKTVNLLKKLGQVGAFGGAELDDTLSGV